MRDKTKNTNDFLCVIDASYFRYFIAFGAVSKFQKDFPEEASVWIKPPEECDQNNLPNLLNCDTFKRILVKQTMKRLETIDYIAKANFQNELDCADKIDIVFAMDDRLKNNFRLALYPSYKGQRKLIKRSYNVFAITDYITDIIFKDLDVENRYGYHFANSQFSKFTLPNWGVLLNSGLQFSKLRVYFYRDLLNQHLTKKFSIILYHRYLSITIIK